MKRLYILRHAQALNTPVGGKDFDRNLSSQGHDDAQALGKIIREKSYAPSLVLYSAAMRTFQTYDGLQLGKTQSHSNADLYDANAEYVIDIIHDLDDDYNSLMLIGHNPTIHELCMRLASEDSPPSFMQRLMQNYKPGTLSVFDCPCIFWNDLQLGENTLIDFQEPMDYNAADRPTRWM